jgi:hypothetical protein
MKKILLICLILIFLISLTYAADYTVTITGRLVTPTQETDTPYGINAYVNGAHQYPASGTNLNEDRSFEFKDISFNEGDDFKISLMSSCANHELKVERQGDEFVILDLQDDSKVIVKTGASLLELGNLLEDKSGRLQFNSDTIASVYLPRAGGTSAGYTGYITTALTPGESYLAEIYDTTGTKLIEKEIVSNPEYCQTTLITKQDNDISVSYCKNEECQESEGGKIDYKFYKGWNLISAPLLSSINGSSNQCTQKYKAVYIYNTSYKGYVGAIGTQPNQKYVPNKETFDKYLNYSNPNWKLNSYTDTIQLTAYWMYFDSECTSKIDTSFLTNTNQSSTREIMNKTDTNSKLLKGWNFIGTAGWMEGSNFKTIFEDCTIEKANYFDNAKQQWGASSSTTFASQISESTGSPSAISGNGYVIKVANDCYIKYSSSDSMNPPALPN